MTHWRPPSSELVRALQANKARLSPENQVFADRGILRLLNPSREPRMTSEELEQLVVSYRQNRTEEKLTRLFQQTEDAVQKTVWKHFKPYEPDFALALSIGREVTYGAIERTWQVGKGRNLRSWITLLTEQRLIDLHRAERKHIKGRCALPDEQVEDENFPYFPPQLVSPAAESIAEESDLPDKLRGRKLDEFLTTLSPSTQSGVANGHQRAIERALRALPPAA